MADLVPAGADRLWVEDTGGGGTPVVLLHPGIADSRVWDRMLPLLGAHRVVRFDRRGFGQSPRATEAFVPMEDLLAVLDHLGAERAHLVGNSMGGEISLATAVTHPDRVASLTVLCPGIGGYPWPDPKPEEAELYARWGAAREAGDLDTLSRIGLDEWCRSGADDYLAEQMRATMETDLAHDGLEQDDPPQWDALPDLTVPATVIAGELDPWESLQASLDLAERIPDAALVRLPVDHLPQYRDPEAVAAAVVDTIGRAASA